METYTDTYGNHWSTDSCLTFGPYGGGGSVACANLRWIERQRNISVMPSQRVSLCGERISFGHYDDDFSDYDVVMVPGAFGGRTAFINMAGDLRENMDALSDYPVFNEELVSQVELEWEEQAWPDTLRFLMDGAPTDALHNYFSRRTDQFGGMFFQAYRDAMDETNTYPEPDHDSVFIDTAKIADAFWKNLLSAFKRFHKERWANKPYRKMMLYLPGFEKKQN